MKHYFGLFLCLLLGGNLLSPIHAQQSGADEKPTLLKPVFEPDKTYRFVSRTTVYMAPPGENQRLIVLEQQARFDASPRASGEKGVDLFGRTERLQVNIQSGDKQVQYDSLKKDNASTPIGRHFDSTVNRHVKMELNGQMKIVSHKEGGRSVSATPLPGLPRFGPDELIQLINTVPQGYAPDPVITGDEWVLKGKRNVGDLGNLGFEMTYKLNGTVDFERHACREIEFRGHISGNISDTASRYAEFQGSSISGVLLYDPKISMIRHSEHTVTMVINVPDRETKVSKRVPMQQKVVLQLMQMVDKK